MDLLRACYTTEMRFWEDDDRTTPVTWFFTEPGAKVFPAAHVFNSLNWVGDKDQANPVGEVTGVPRRFSNGVAPTYTTGDLVLGRLRGLHFCGPKTWYDNPGNFPGKPLGTNPQGFSWCCLGWPERVYMHIVRVVRVEPNPNILVQPGDVLPWVLDRIEGWTVSGCVEGTTGQIRVLYNKPPGTIQWMNEGELIEIAGVLGTVEANGRWEVHEVIDGGFTLVGSNFVNPYQGGGVITNDAFYYYVNNTQVTDQINSEVVAFGQIEAFPGIIGYKPDGYVAGGNRAADFVRMEPLFLHWPLGLGNSLHTGSDLWEFYIDTNPHRTFPIGTVFFPSWFFPGIFPPTPW